MFNIFKTKPARTFINGEPPKEANLKFRFVLKLDAERGYSENGVSEVEITRTLISTTDTPVNELKKELSEIIESAVSTLERDIDSTNRLSDGAIAAKRTVDNSSLT